MSKQEENGNGMTIRAGGGTLRYLLTLVLAVGGMTGGGYYAVQSKAEVSVEALATLKTQQAAMSRELDQHVEEQREFLRLMSSVDSRLSKIEGRLEVIAKSSGK